MAEFYARMKGVADRLLAPTSQGGLGQGEIMIHRTVKGTPDPEKPWIPVEDTVVSEKLDGAVRGVSSRLVGVEAGGTVIIATDRQAICTVPTMGYTAGDRLSVDGVPVHIIDVSKIPAAGVTAAVNFVIRG